MGEVNSMSQKYVTGDEMLDCIVGIKSSKMEEEGINFSVDGVIDGGLGMKPVDICSVFANAIDNAIEVCENLSQNGNRWIKLSLNKMDESYLVKLSHTVPIEEKKGFTGILFGTNEKISPKKKSLNDFGIQNMRAAISKYKGTEKSEVKDGVFTLSITIPRSEV